MTHNGDNWAYDTAYDGYDITILTKSPRTLTQVDGYF